MIDERAMNNSLKADLVEEFDALHQRGYLLTPGAILTAKSRVWWKYRKTEVAPEALKGAPLFKLVNRALGELEAEGKLDRFRVPVGVTA